MTDDVGNIVGGLELLLAAIHADDPKREILVRVGDLMRDAKKAADALERLSAETATTLQELDRVRADRDYQADLAVRWKAQFESASAAASEYSEFWEMNGGAEVSALRGIISRCATEIGNGAVVSPDCSIEFMAHLPEEIAAHTDKLRRFLKCARDEGGEALNRAGAAEAQLAEAVDFMEWLIGFTGAVRSHPLNEYGNKVLRDKVEQVGQSMGIFEPRKTVPIAPPVAGQPMGGGK